MTHSLLPRARISRRLAALTAVGVVGAMSTLAVGAPAAAEPVTAYGACPSGFGATAASDILTLRALDAQPLGARFTPVVGVHLAPTESGMAGSPARAAAEADVVQGDALGRELPNVGVYQQAPPTHSTGVSRSPAAANLGVLSFGAGTVAAHATWQDAKHCQPDTGLRSDSTATTAQVSVLPGPGDKALLRAVGLRSGTSTGITSRNGVPAATATATGDVTRFALFAGTPSEVTVAVISQPRLTVTAGHTQSVTYSAPVLRITAPGTAPTSLSSAGDHVDLVISNPTVNTNARPTHHGGGPEGGTDPVNSLIGSLPVPSLSGLLDDMNSAPSGLGHNDPRFHAGANQSVVLRLSLGALAKQSTSTGVHAEATSIRIKLLLRTGSDNHGHSPCTCSSGSSDSSGYSGASGSSGSSDSAADVILLDTGLCVLNAAAASPTGWTNSGYGSGGSNSGGSGSGYGGGGTGGASPTPTPSTPAPTGTLPVTGSRVSLIIGAGVVLLVAGRMLLVLTRRRHLPTAL